MKASTNRDNMQVAEYTQASHAEHSVFLDVLDIAKNIE
jgi:hypothetical protein